MKIDDRSSTLRAFHLLSAIAASPIPLGITELMTSSELPKPTVYRMLRMLEDAGLIVRDASARGYRGGSALAELGLAIVAGQHAQAERRAVLSDLADTTNETVVLAALDGLEVVVLDQVLSPWPLRFGLEPGSRVPAHSCAAGKTLLAAFTDARLVRTIEKHSLARLAARTLTDPVALRKEIELVRKDGYALEDEEYLAGLVAIAIPLATKDGRVFAALTVAGPRARFDPAVARSHLPALRRTADALAAAIGVPTGEAASVR
jgi:IclR family transcriptional regulator, acetate operon repressor